MLAQVRLSGHHPLWPSLLYLVQCRILELVMKRRTDSDKDLEILVLRHQVKILERQLHGRLRYRPADRALLGALSRLLPRWRWRSFLVTPDTLLRWHREAARRKWRRWRKQRRPGRRALRPDVVQLIILWVPRMSSGPLSWTFVGVWLATKLGHGAVVPLSGVRSTPPITPALGRDSEELAIEVVMLRHEVAVLPRQVARPALRPSDRALLTELSRLLGRRYRSKFFIQAETLLRWHRDLVRRRWTYPHGSGRPNVPAGTVQIVLRMAREIARTDLSTKQLRCRYPRRVLRLLM